MNDVLHRLVYYSRNRIAGPPEQIDVIIAHILEVSRRNNERVGVTGALMFNDGCFAQVLEGPTVAVEQTFERIQQDPNHGDVLLLACEPVTARAFDNWSMAYVGRSTAGAARYGGIAGSTGFDPVTLTANDLFEILHTLTLEEEEAPARQSA